MARFSSTESDPVRVPPWFCVPAVQLSKHDLSQLDEAALAALSVEALRALSLKLLSDLKLAYERLDQNPRNSSRPPSSVAPWDRPPKDADDEAADQAPPEERDHAAEGASDAGAPEPAEGAEGSTPAAPPADTSNSTNSDAPPRRRPGQQPKAPGHGRLQQLPIDHEVAHSPERCARCGEVFAEGAPERCYHAHYVIDLRVPDATHHALGVIQVKHCYFERDCGCGHATRAEPGHTPKDESWSVALSERHLAGSLLVALICALALRMRLSRRRIQEFLADWLALELGIATINQCVHEAARAVEPVVEEQLIPQLRASPLVHADETSWFEQGRLLWLWVFTSATTTVFTIGKRSQAVLLSVLGALFEGWLMSDGYWAYRDYDKRLRCLAHLLRKARGLEESLDRQARHVGEQLRTGLETVMEAVYAAREGPPPTALRQQHAKQLQGLLAVCLAHVDAEHAKTRALARELLNDWDTFWVVLDEPELPLTNNTAERALRHWVIARRIGQGTRTQQGSRSLALLASVIETCRQRGHSPWTYLAEVMRARRQGLPAPILPAAMTA
jgi:transposase